MNEECLICKSPLSYLETAQPMTCELCGKTEHSKTACIKGHYVCDECHTRGMDAVIGICLAQTGKNPIEILNTQCIGKRCPFSPQNHKPKKKVAFLCVHNYCRSQIAEALGKHLASDVFESYSAGSELKPRINPDAVRLMKQLYNIDMEETQRSKLFAEIPTPDLVISMGCDVGCPYIGRAFDDNWNLPDPTGESDAVFMEVIRKIEENIRRLRDSLTGA